jgi:hypothetical protein
MLTAQGSLAGGDGKASRQHRRTDGRREGDRPVPNENCRRDGREQQYGRRPRRRLLIEGEIDDDPAAKGDRKPGHQPSRSDLGLDPFADLPRHAAREAGNRLGPRPDRPPSGCDRGPPRLGASARSSLIDHRAAPEHPRLHRGGSVHERSVMNTGGSAAHPQCRAHPPSCPATQSSLRRLRKLVCAAGHPRLPWDVHEGRRRWHRKSGSRVAHH